MFVLLYAFLRVDSDDVIWSNYIDFYFTKYCHCSNEIVDFRAPVSNDHGLPFKDVFVYPEEKGRSSSASQDTGGNWLAEKQWQALHESNINFLVFCWAIETNVLLLVLQYFSYKKGVKLSELQLF